MSQEVTRPSDEEVIQAFRSYLDERLASGVLFAKAVTSLTFDGGILSATFDPSSVGVTEEVFLYANPFDTLAEFVGTPIAFDDEEGRKLRTRVRQVRATFEDGRDLGSISAAELFFKGTGTEWGGS